MSRAFVQASNESITTINSPAGMTAFTFACWVKVANFANGGGTIMLKDPGTYHGYLEITGSGELYASFGGLYQGSVQNVTVVNGGTGYAVNDTGTLEGGTDPYNKATYSVNTEGGGIVVTCGTPGGGQGYTALQTYTTAVTTGGGDGALTLSVNSIINQSAAFGWSVETLVPNTWTHVAVTWNSVTDGVLHLYINGVECTYQDATISKVADSGDSGAWVFGSDNGGYNLPNGSLAECVIYNTALSGGQIAALAASTIGATGSPTNYWHLCGTTSPEPDVVAANDGTLSVPPPTQDSDSPGYSCSSSGGGAKTVICIIGN